MAERPFTGRHAAMVFGGAFAVIIGVNVVLAVSAVRTFPGLEVANSYVASQRFDERRAAQQALGWTARAGVADGLVSLTISDALGAPAKVAALSASLGRATHAKDDIELEFRFDGRSFVAHAELAEGYWNMRIRATAADGAEFSQRLMLYIGG